jgi:hypothetical protein
MAALDIPSEGLQDEKDQRSCAEIATAIDTNLRSLVTPLRDVTARHRSMWATFEHSWRQLSREQRRILGRLAIFCVGITDSLCCVCLVPGVRMEASRLTKTNNTKCGLASFAL